MVSELMFNEIMQMSNDKNCSLIFALEKMSQYCKDIKLLTNEKNEVFYQVNANALRSSNIESDDLLFLNQSGWVLSKDKIFVEYFI